MYESTTNGNRTTSGRNWLNAEHRRASIIQIVPLVMAMLLTRPGFGMPQGATVTEAGASASWSGRMEMSTGIEIIAGSGADSLRPWNTCCL